MLEILEEYELDWNNRSLIKNLRHGEGESGSRRDQQHGDRKKSATWLLYVTHSVQLLCWKEFGFLNRRKINITQVQRSAIV